MTFISVKTGERATATIFGPSIAYLLDVVNGGHIKSAICLTHGEQVRSTETKDEIEVKIAAAKLIKPPEPARPGPSLAHGDTLVLRDGRIFRYLGPHPDDGAFHLGILVEQDGDDTEDDSIKVFGFERDEVLTVNGVRRVLVEHERMNFLIGVMNAPQSDEAQARLEAMKVALLAGYSGYAIIDHAVWLLGGPK